MSFFSNIKEKIRNSEDLAGLRSIGFRDILNGKIFTNKIVRRQYPFILFLVILSVIYIDNRYIAEKQIYQIVILNQDIQDTKFESLTVSAELMKVTTRSNIIHLLEQNKMNVKPGVTPPIVIE